MQHNFTYDNRPAYLIFDEQLGVLSEIWYFEDGVQTRRVIEEFAFNERELKITVKGSVTVIYNENLDKFIKGPDLFSFNATGQETLDYFAVPSTPERVKRMEVNGTAIEYLNMILFNPETGEFAPTVLPPATPVE